MISDRAERPSTALPGGPLPGRRAVWVVAALALVLGVVLALAIPRLLTPPSAAVDCSIGSPTWDESCADEPPADEDLVHTGETR